MPADLRKRARALAWFTIGYNLLEGVLSIAAGVAAGSVALIGFGLDSFVETLSAGIMVWRLRRTEESEEENRRERRALRLIGWTFYLFAAYVLFESGEKLYFREAPEPSIFGMIIAAVSTVVMPALYLRKLRIGQALGMRSLIADSKETLACAYLSVSLLAGLGLNALFGWWWADPLTGILVAYFLVREGMEAFETEEEEENAEDGH